MDTPELLAALQTVGKTDASQRARTTLLRRKVEIEGEPILRWVVQAKVGSGLIEFKDGWGRDVHHQAGRYTEQQQVAFWGVVVPFVFQTVWDVVDKLGSDVGSYPQRMKRDTLILTEKYLLDFCYFMCCLMAKYEKELIALNDVDPPTPRDPKTEFNDYWPMVRERVDALRVSQMKSPFRAFIDEQMPIFAAILSVISTVFSIAAMGIAWFK